MKKTKRDYAPRDKNAILIHEIADVITKHPTRVSVAEDPGDEIYLAFASDLSAPALLEVMIDISSLKPDECDLMLDGTLRLWWD